MEIDRSNKSLNNAQMNSKSWLVNRPGGWTDHGFKWKQWQILKVDYSSNEQPLFIIDVQINDFCFHATKRFQILCQYIIDWFKS